MTAINKLIIVLVCSLIYTHSFAQLTMIPGQPDDGFYNSAKSVIINEDLSFLFYYKYDESNDIGLYVYLLDGDTIEEVDFDVTGYAPGFKYIGTLNNRYYFVNRSAQDGFVYEYNHGTNETAILSLPEEEYHLVHPFTTMNGKMYFAAKPTNNPDYGMISYDGFNFEAIPKPVSAEFEWWRHYYSPSQNLLYLHYVNFSQTDSKIYTYDGTDFNQIQLTQDLLMGSFFDEFNSKVIMIMGSRDNNYNIQLYECDGNTLTHVNPGEGKIFDFASYSYKDDKRYYNFTDETFENVFFYEYDGSTLSLIASYPEYSYGQFLSEFDGKDFFSLFRNDTGESWLHSYDGTNLTLIEGEQSATWTGITYGGTLNNELYAIYYREDGQNILTSYSSGASEVIPVPNTPDSIIGDPIKFNDMIIDSYKISSNPFERTYYAMTSSNEFSELQVAGYHNPYYEFRRNNKLYFSFDSEDYTEAKLFSWDGVLDVPDNESSINEVLVFPNPTKDKLTVQLPLYSDSGEVILNLYSMDGKKMGIYLRENNSSKLDFSMAHLGKGMYILEIINDSGSTFKKIIKK